LKASEVYHIVWWPLEYIDTPEIGILQELNASNAERAQVLVPVVEVSKSIRGFGVREGIAVVSARGS
jgi:hypothetical protein